MADVLWRDIEEEIQTNLDSQTFSAGGDRFKYLRKWGNRVIRDVCMEIDMRHHLRLSCTRTFTTSEYSLNLKKNDYFKMSERFTRVRVDDEYISIIGLEKLNEFDPDHDATTDDTKPSYVSIEGRRLYVYPMFAGDIVIENYFRAPVDMTGGDSNPDLEDDTVVEDLLISGVCRKGFRILGDKERKRECDADYAYYLDLYRKHIDKNNSKQVVEFKDY